MIGECVPFAEITYVITPESGAPFMVPAGANSCFTGTGLMLVDDVGQLLCMEATGESHSCLR